MLIVFDQSHWETDVNHSIELAEAKVTPYLKNPVTSFKSVHWQVDPHQVDVAVTGISFAFDSLIYLRGT